MSDLELYLRATPFIDAEDAAIRELAASLSLKDQTATAIALFNWVRDSIRYDPMAALAERDEHRASAVLRRGSGFCVQKAVLLAALARAAGIPSRLGFADVRNHKIPPRLRQLMGTDLFVFHGYVELFLDGRWLKAAPTFDPESARKAGILPVELDGEHDAMLHPVDPAGQPFIERLRDRGHYAELPFSELDAALREAYARFWQPAPRATRPDGR